MSGRRTRTSDKATSGNESTTTTPVAGKPLRIFRARGVSVAVFENHATIEGRAVTFLKAELRRVYRDGEEFRSTHSLSANDIPVARLLLERAFAFMLQPGLEADGEGVTRANGAGSNETPGGG